MRTRSVIVCSGILVAVGCAEQPQAVEPEPVPTAAPLEVAKTDDGVAQEPYEKQLSGIRFTVPAGWREVQPQSSVLQAEFRLDGAGGEARLTLSSAGGSIADNVDRWIGQFTARTAEPRQEQVDLGEHTATLLDVSGDYQAGFGPRARLESDWRLLGAVIPMVPQNYFVKLTGPQDTVAERAEEFRSFLHTARFD